MNVAILGAGSWGTALGRVLGARGNTVTLWDIDTAVLDAINEEHRNTRYLPDVRLPDTMRADADLHRALAGAELVVVAVPSQVVRSVTTDAREAMAPGTYVCSVVKGVELDTLYTMHEVLEEVLPVPMHPYLTVLSGPSFAVEVAEELPTAVTVAAHWEHAARTVQQAFASPRFRPYTSNDVIGVEIGGAVKNVIAIASGAAEGLGFGANARAAIVTRGSAEITRLAVRLGANPQTLAALAGHGDLLLTCSSTKSRNFRVGVGLGQGRDLAEVQAELGQVAEGVVNARSTHELAQKYEVDMPIGETVYRVLYEGMTCSEAVEDLLSRDLRPERL